MSQGTFEPQSGDTDYTIVQSPGTLREALTSCVRDMLNEQRPDHYHYRVEYKQPTPGKVVFNLVDRADRGPTEPGQPRELHLPSSALQHLSADELADLQGAILTTGNTDVLVVVYDDSIQDESDEGDQ